MFLICALMGIIFCGDGSYWMHFLDKSKSFRQFTLVGSHDSGTYRLNREYSPGAHTAVKSLMDQSRNLEEKLYSAFNMCKKDFLDICLSTEVPVIWQFLSDFYSDKWDFVDDYFDNYGNWISGAEQWIGKEIPELLSYSVDKVEGDVCVSDVVGDDFCDFLGPFPFFEWVADFIRAFEMLQRETISDQLHSGVRLLDLRVCFDEDGVPYTCSPNLLGDEFEHILDEIAEFVDDEEHNEETIIVSISGFQYPPDLVGEKGKIRLKEDFALLIYEKIGRFLIFPPAQEGKDKEQVTYESLSASYSEFLTLRSDTSRSGVMVFSNEVIHNQFGSFEEYDEKEAPFSFVWGDGASFGGSLSESSKVEVVWERQGQAARDGHAWDGKSSQGDDLFQLFWTASPMTDEYEELVDGFDSFSDFLRNYDFGEVLEDFPRLESIKDIFHLSDYFEDVNDAMNPFITEIIERMDSLFHKFTEGSDKILGFAQGNHVVNRYFEEFAESLDEHAKSNVDVVVFDFVTPSMLNWINHHFNGIKGSAYVEDYVRDKMKDLEFNRRKIVHISDLHLGVDPALDENVRELFEFISEEYATAVYKPMVLLTGDLVNDGSEEQFNLLKKSLSLLNGFIVRISIGNHDIGSGGLEMSDDSHHLFYEMFEEETQDYHDDQISIYVLDSMIGRNDDRNADGGLGIAQRNELSRKLQEDRKNFRILMMHHHPFTYGTYQASMELKDSLAFQEIIFEEKVELVLTGHMHCQKFFETYQDGVKGPYVISSTTSSGKHEDCPHPFLEFLDKKLRNKDLAPPKVFGTVVSFLEITLDKDLEKPFVTKYILDHSKDEVTIEIEDQFLSKELMADTDIVS